MDVPVLLPLCGALAGLCVMVALRLRATVSPFDLRRPSPPPARWFGEVVGGAVARSSVLSWLMGSGAVEERLSLAGLKMRVEEFHALQLAAVGCALAGVIAWLLTGNFLFIAAAALVKLPDAWLSHLTVQRRKVMRREFMMVGLRFAAALSAGLSLDKALEWAARGNERSPLQQELRVCLDKLAVKIPFEQAFEEFAARTGLLDARRLATAVIQAQRFGVSVAERVAAAVEDSRERRTAEIIGQAISAEKKLEAAVFVMALPTIILAVAPMALSMRGGVFVW
ncbi:MAG: type II secretion system F family protein [Bacillota bacterium]|nr:type II secretion system F family protein [Bacillota bacterium]